MSNTQYELTVLANDLDTLASATTNDRVYDKLTRASVCMRTAALELADNESVPVWLIPLQDLTYTLCVAILHAGFNVRTMVTPGTKQYNVHTFAIDAYERLMESVKSVKFNTTRASRQYPYTTRRAVIRKKLNEVKNEYE